MNERLKYLRKEILKLTQQEFSDKIDLGRATIGNIEIGKINLTDRNIKAVCDTFGVSEKWLRTGDGDMFSPPANETELIDGTSRKRMVTAILKMTTQECDTLERLIGLLLENKNT